MTVINEMAREQMQSKGLLTGGYKQLGKFCQKELANDELAMFNHILLKLSTSCYHNLFDYLADREDFGGSSGEYAKQILSDLCNSNNNSYYVLKLIASANYMSLQKAASEETHAFDVRSFIRTCSECDFFLLRVMQSFNIIHQDMVSETEYIDKKILINNVSVFSNQYTRASELILYASISLVEMVQKLNHNIVVSELEALKVDCPKLQEVINCVQRIEGKSINIDFKIGNISSSIRALKEDAEKRYAKLPQIAEEITIAIRGHRLAAPPNWKLSKRSLEDKLRKNLKDRKITPLKVNKRTEYWSLEEICTTLANISNNSPGQGVWLGELWDVGTPKKNLKIKQ